MHLIRKSFNLDMAHQLVKAYSKECSDTIHGHTFKLELFFKGSLSDSGMIVDFGFLKTSLSAFLKKWDHSLVLSNAMEGDYKAVILLNNKKVNFIYRNPTAENLSKLFFYEIDKVLKDSNKHPCLNNDFELSKVRLHETESGYAEYSIQ